MTDHRIRCRIYLLIAFFVALLMITVAHYRQSPSGQGGEKRASAISHTIDCDGSLLIPLNQLPGTRDSENYYIGNPHTKVFHRPSCHYLPAPDNRIYFESRAQAIDAGYRSCRRCNP